jgi:hypothetical protein
MFGKKNNFNIKPQKQGGFDFGDRGQDESLASKVRRNGFFNFIITFFKSLNPDAYQRLSVRKVSQGFSYLLSLVLFSLFIAAVIMIPRLSSVSGSVENALSGFSALSLSADVKSPVVFDFGVKTRFEPMFRAGSVPAVVSNSSNLTSNSTKQNKTSAPSLGSDIVITSGGVYHKPIPCMLWNGACFLYRSEDRIIRTGGEGFFDALKYKSEYSKIIGTAIILMMPSLLLILLAIYYIKYAVLMLFMAVLMYFAAIGVKHKISFRKVLSTSIYSGTAMVFLQVINLPLHFLSGILSFLPFALYLIFFSIGIIIQDSDVF